MPDNLDKPAVTATTDGQPSAADQERTRRFLKLATDRWRLASEAENKNRIDALDDFEFYIGNQWPADIQTRRSNDGRPCLTMNRLPQFVRYVTNEQRRNRPAVKVSPLGQGATVETAEMLQGVVRHIEVISNADVAYDTAFENTVIGGFSYLRLSTEYADETGFDQDIRIKRIKNPFTVYYDPSCMEPDYRDARFAFIIEDLTAEEYKAQYPRSQVATLNLFTSTGDNPAGWLSKDSCRVAEYFYVEEEKSKLFKLEDGFICTEDEYRVLPPDAPPVADMRVVLNRRVRWAKINALEILEEADWPGRWIPVIPVIADDVDVNGKRHVAGLVRNAKDPQRMYNYHISAATETIALAPKAPFIAAEGQTANHEQEWAAANIRNMPVLYYKPLAIGGQAVPPPQRQVAEPPIQAVSLMTRQSDNDLKASMGIYDASLGERGPEQSGKAILARQQQGSIATLNFSDNMNRAIRFVGEQLVDLIPKIYDAPRILRIVKPDETVDQVGVFNSQSTGLDQAKAQAMLQGVKRIYDVGVGKYDVTISSGPSYQSRRQEAVESMSALIQAYPAVMGVVGDLLVRQMDWPFAQEIADRLKRTLPPELREDDSTDPKAQVSKLQQQLKMLMEQHAAMTAELNRMSEEIRTRKLEAESKERIAAMQTQAQLAETQAKILGEAGLELLKAQILEIQQRLKLLGEDKPVGEESPAPTPAPLEGATPSAMTGGMPAEAPAAAPM